ncbi:hypothetical protein CLU84_1578 [Comamonas sp. 26]|nr:hypothetical protein CLU84_1578 [Comamonas sp. 26]
MHPKVPPERENMPHSHACLSALTIGIKVHADQVTAQAKLVRHQIRI